MATTKDRLTQRRLDLEARRAALPAFKQQELEGLLKKALDEGAPARVIPSRPPGEAAPLSFGQERTWFLQQLEPGSAAENISIPLRIKGRLNAVALEQSFDGLVNRHEILRTTFPAVGGRPVQRVAEPSGPGLRLVNISALPERERESVLARLVDEAGRRPFDLERGPLLRNTLIRLGDEEHVLIMLFHHIVFDEWSLDVLIRDLGQIYAACDRGEPAALAEMPIQYADFAAWQREWMQGPVLEEELSYWRRQLQDSPQMLNLPTDRPRPSVMSFKGDAVSARVPELLTEKLRDFSRASGATLFMTLIASLQMLLARYCGQDDIVVATPTTGRRWVETEGLIGFFINTLLIRSKFDGDQSLREAVRRVAEVVLEAQTHQALPFEKLVEALQPERSLSRTPLFEVMFIFQNATKTSLGVDEFSTDWVETKVSTEKFSLSFSVYEGERELDCSLGYSTDLFERGTAERIVAHWLRMLEALAEDADQALGRVELFSAEEREQILARWNDTRREWDGASLLEMFDRQVGRTPDAPAAVFGDGRLSYAELDGRANQLAHRLRRMGVGADSRVGVCVERGLEMAVAVLGVLKAGGAYVPLDPAYPEERIKFMLDDSQCAALLVSEGAAANLPEMGGGVLYLDRDWEEVARESAENPHSPVDAENLAYVIYTSGSTGRPKGIAMTRRALTNLIRWQSEALPGPARTLQFASLSFDVSFQELFSTWCSGGTLVLVSEETRRDASELLRLMSERQVERVFLPFVFLQHLAEASAAGGAAPESLREVVTAGEQLECTAEIVRLCERVGCRLHNHYGPAETHVVTAHTLGGPPSEWPTLPPIGRPIANARLYVLDTRLRPVPVGVAGELYVGGDNNARGYLNRPALTAEKFIPNPFGVEAGERIYRTGDLARYLPDGEVEFLGRADTQVKIRGYRVEPGEVEATLRKHPEVRDVAVVERKSEAGDRRLVAYLVAEREDAPPAAGGLREYLKGLLPDYMIPSAFVVVERMPLTPSGKLDRASLPDPRLAQAEAGQGYASPRTMVEEVLTAIWAQVLGLERVGRYDNFFHLGGHSLLATQIASRVRESFRVELPVRVVFELPTLAELAERIESMMRSGVVPEAPPLSRTGVGRQPPLSYAQQRLWFLDQLAPGSNAYNLPAEMYIDDGINVGALEQALDEVVRRHETLRTTFAVAGGQPVQVISPPRPSGLRVVDLTGLKGREFEEEEARLRGEDALRPFDLAAGPLFRATLIRLGEGRHLFLLNMHHIVSDGWSMGVLMREMEALYEAFSRGLPSPLPELEIQYADYACWQRGWLQGDVLQKEVDYWRRRLEGAPTLLELETDHPRQPAARSLRGAHFPVAFSEEVSRSLREFSRREGATLFMTLMAGFHALLWRYTGQSDILVGTPVAGRGRVELEPLIGFFVNMIPIRTSFGDGPTFRDLVRQVRESAFAAYTHQELPFDRLVEELQPSRAPGRNPIFQVILAFRDAAPESGVTRLTLPAGAPVSADTKFDIEVHLQDTPSGIKGSFVYSPELFEPSLVARMADHFARLFQKALAEPDGKLAALSLLDEAEYRQVVEEWNDTASPYPDALCVHEMFQQQAERCPDAIAVEFEGENVSYAELNRRANRLAHALRAEGVGPEVFVGVMLERSVELIVALLAVAKAGGVYVPINLGDPPARIRLILEDAGVKVLLTSERIAEGLPKGELTIIRADAEEYRGPKVTAGLADAPANLVGAGNLVYMMYTSGSTGTPKGVCITHRNIMKLVKGADYAVLDEDEVFLQFSPFSFDVSTFEIWGSLLNGGRLVVFPPVMPSLTELAEFINRTQVTTLWLTAGLFQQLFDASVKSMDSLRQLLAGGDALSPAHVGKALEQLEGCRLINGYGPTEATTFACCYHVESQRPDTSVPIGRPISNTRAYVVVASGRAAGVGERGELFIGGDGLARCYHGRPDLTAERFVPDPFGPEPGGRLYRTGDAARYLNQGVIQFHGRLDNQVKISGFRIEPGEVETVLAQHPSLSAALVTVREHAPGDKRLVAYVVGRGGPPPGGEELRAYMRERVPEYMTPSAFVALEELPLTPNGKIDRAALPAPQSALGGSGREHVAPRNGLQQQLVEIWEELFDARPIGITDDFFELGGHSLLMVMLVTRVEERLGKRVAIAELFRKPTVEHLAELIGHGREGSSQSLVVVMQKGGERPPLFSPHAGGGQVLVYTELARHMGDDQPFYGIRAREPEAGLVAHTDIISMASEYVEAVKGVRPEGPYFLAGWSMGGTIAFEMARQLRERGERIALLALLDAEAPGMSIYDNNTKWSTFLPAFALDLGLTHDKFSMPIEELLALPPMTQLRRAWADARAAGLVPKELTLIEFRKLFDTFKVNATTTLSYGGGEYEGRVTLFTPEKKVGRHLFMPDGGEAKQVEEMLPDADPLRGWGRFATEGVEAHVVPGNHFTMIREPHVKVLAEELRGCVEAALRGLGR